MENKNKYKQTKKKNNDFLRNNKQQSRSRVLSLTQLLSRIRLKNNKQRENVIVNSNVTKNNFSSFSNTNRSSFSSQTTGFVSNNITNLQKQKQDNLKQNGTNFQSSNVLNSGSLLLPSANRNNQQRLIQSRLDYKYEQKRQKAIKPIIPPKSLVIILKEKPEKILYNRRIIDYKHCGLLQRYIGLGGKILPRRQTRLTAKQQRYIAKTIKSARIMGLLPFVSKEKGFFR